MNPLLIVLFLVGVAMIVFGFLQIRKRNLLMGLLIIVVGLIVIGLPVAISFFVTLFN